MTWPRAAVVVDLSYGDCGKGTVVDALTHRYASDLTVRTSGGPQAGHNVVTPDGRHHTFSQFGSGTFHGARTLLAGGMLIEPYAMLNEAEHLHAVGVDDVLARTTIDARCRVIAPVQRAANRIRERARGTAAHGTCGLGVGETVADGIDRPDHKRITISSRNARGRDFQLVSGATLVAADLADRRLVREKLRDLTDYKRLQLRPLWSQATADERRLFEDDAWIDVAADVYAAVASRVAVAGVDAVHAIVRAACCPVFESAQGVLLDETHGFAPHTTWSDCTFAPAEALLRAAGVCDGVERIGVIRPYVTRHGPGPLVTERPGLTARLPEPHNPDAGPQGPFRRGVFDLVALRYALAAAGECTLAITHLDRLPALPAEACVAYAMDGRTHPMPPRPTSAATLSRATAVYDAWPVHDADAFVDAIESAAGRRVTVRSFGPTHADKLFVTV